MSYYETICKERCEWCAKGLRLGEGLNVRWHFYPTLERGKDAATCAAPTPLALIEELVAERDAAIQRAETTKRNLNVALRFAHSTLIEAAQTSLNRLQQTGRMNGLNVHARRAHSALQGNLPEYAEIATQTEQIRVLREALDNLLEHSLSNRGTKDEFVTCYTYNLGQIPTVIREAESALKATGLESTLAATPQPAPIKEQE